MAQKRKLNRGLEALLGSGLLAKGQEEAARADGSSLPQRHGPIRALPLSRPAHREPAARRLSAAQGF